MKKKFLGLAAIVASLSLIGGVNAAEIDDAWNKLVKDGVFEAPCVEPTKENDPMGLLIESATNWYIQQTLGSNSSGYLHLDENKEYSLYLVLGTCDENGECAYSDKDDKVSVKWKETNPQVNSLLEEYVKKVESLYTMYEYTFEDGTVEEYRQLAIDDRDITRISEIKNSKDDKFYAESVLHYTDEMIKIFGSSNVDYVLTGRMGNDTGPFYGGAGGGDLSIWYDGVAYFDLRDAVLVEAKNIFYVPEDTDLTSDAFIAAAKKRLDETFGANVIGVKLGGRLDEIQDLTEEVMSRLKIDRSKTTDNYYVLTINGKDYNFIIEKNSNIKGLPTMESVDMVTNVSVKTTSTDVPLDAVVKVEEIKTDAPVYKKAYETIKKEIIKAFDISLTSKSAGNITKLENGSFEVRIPLGNGFVGRKLSAYYLRDNGTLEEHPITLDNEGNATFETTHFSEYFIAEAGAGSFDEEVPKTLDKADIYMMLAISAGIGLVSSIFFFRTKTN